MPVFTTENPFIIIWKFENFSFFPMIDNDNRLYEFSEDFGIGINDGDESIWKVFVIHKLVEAENIVNDGNFEIFGGQDDLVFKAKSKRVIEKDLSIVYRHFNDSYLTDINDTLKKRTILEEDNICIKISLWGSLPIQSNLTGACVRSEIETERCQQIWTIKNFSSCTTENMTLTFPQTKKYELTLSLTSEEDVKISIQNLEESEFSKTFMSEISIMNSAGCIEFSKQKCHQFKELNEIFEFSFLKKNRLTENYNSCIINDELVLLCDFVVLNQSVKHIQQEYIYENIQSAPNIIYKKSYIHDFVENKFANNLQDDFKKMFISKSLTDMIFQIDGKHLQAHRCVLACRSPVFKSMFELESVESKTGIVDIKDISYNVMNMMLMYMYGETSLDLGYENSQELMIAADKYQIIPLKEKCSAFLKSQLSSETFYDILVLSDMLSDDSLKSFAINYLKGHKGILMSSGWKHLFFNNNRLVGDVLTTLMSCEE